MGDARGLFSDQRRVPGQKQAPPLRTQVSKSPIPVAESGQGGGLASAGGDVSSTPGDGDGTSVVTAEKLPTELPPGFGGEVRAASFLRVGRGWRALLAISSGHLGVYDFAAHTLFALEVFAAPMLGVRHIALSRTNGTHALCLSRDRLVLLNAETGVTLWEAGMSTLFPGLDSGTTDLPRFIQASPADTQPPTVPLAFGNRLLCITVNENEESSTNVGVPISVSTNLYEAEGGSSLELHLPEMSCALAFTQSRSELLAVPLRRCGSYQTPTPGNAPQPTCQVAERISPVSLESLWEGCHYLSLCYHSNLLLLRLSDGRITCSRLDCAPEFASGGVYRQRGELTSFQARLTPIDSLLPLSFASHGFSKTPAVSPAEAPSFDESGSGAVSSVFNRGMAISALDIPLLGKPPSSLYLAVVTGRFLTFLSAKRFLDTYSYLTGVSPWTPEDTSVSASAVPAAIPGSLVVGDPNIICPVGEKEKKNDHETRTAAPPDSAEAESLCPQSMQQPRQDHGVLPFSDVRKSIIAILDAYDEVLRPCYPAWDKVRKAAREVVKLAEYQYLGLLRQYIWVCYPYLASLARKGQPLAIPRFAFATREIEENQADGVLGSTLLDMFAFYRFYFSIYRKNYLRAMDSALGSLRDTIFMHVPDTAIVNRRFVVLPAKAGGSFYGDDIRERERGQRQEQSAWSLLTPAYDLRGHRVVSGKILPGNLAGRQFLRVYRQLTHRYIFSYVGHGYSDYNLFYVFTEAPTRMTLLDVFRGKEAALAMFRSEQDVKEFALGLLEAIAFINADSIKLIHRELRPSQIWLKTDRRLFCKPKIYHIGFMAPLAANEPAEARTMWAAPEVVCGGVSSTSDVWSIGTICFRLLQLISAYREGKRQSRQVSLPGLFLAPQDDDTLPEQQRGAVGRFPAFHRVWSEVLRSRDPADRRAVARNSFIIKQMMLVSSDKQKVALESVSTPGKPPRPGVPAVYRFAPFTQAEIPAAAAYSKIPAYMQPAFSASTGVYPWQDPAVTLPGVRAEQCYSLETVFADELKEKLVTPQALDFIRTCWTFSVRRRPTAAQAKKHAWFQRANGGEH